MSKRQIDIGKPSTRERKKRRRELVLALVCAVLIAIFTFVELKFLNIRSSLFLVLFNLNFILLLLVLYLVVRNGVKLILERRRNVLGSKLRTRLVLAFIFLSLTPTLLMFAVSVKFVQTSVDYWFKGQVENSMEQALELGRAFYGSAQERLERRGGNMLVDIRERQFAWGGKVMDEYLEVKFKEYDLSLLGVLSAEGVRRNLHASSSAENALGEIVERINWEELRQNPRYWSTLMPTAGNDLIVGLLPVDDGRTGYLVLGESIGEGLLFRLDQVVRGLDEYQKLKTMSSPLKMTLYLALGVMTMLIILGATWFGFRLAKEITAPVQALAAGTERVARGDLSVRLEDRSDDEMGFLVRSFNRMTEDLTEYQSNLKTANDRLAQQNQEVEARGKYIETVLDNITSGVVSVDYRGRVSTVNKAAAKMLGIEGNSLVGREPLALLQGDFAELLADALTSLLISPGSQWTRQIDLPLKGGDLRVLVNVVSLKTGPGGGEAGIVAVFEDITELEKMQRLAAWREVARRIAHEIKNPLTPIKLSVQRLQRRYGQRINEKVFSECTEIIIHQVERMQRMVAEFSAYAKLPEMVPKRDHLPSLLEEVVSLFENSHRDIRWKLTFRTNIKDFPFDREGLRKVFINLLTNAAEALGETGDARVEVEAWHDEDRGMVVVEVADNGPGFSPDERSRMFEPYFSSKKSGTGLGLTIVKSIAKDHRGQVDVRPNSPQGSIFSVELPDV